jgi:uncharacterized repeat protein (TIGR01451 family)
VATFTITVTNLGPGDATGVTLTDTVPNNVAAPGWTVGGANGGSCAPNPVAGGGLLTCNFGTLTSGETRTITISATTTVANCPSISNTGVVSATNEAAAQQGNNSSTATMNVTCPDVTVSKTAAQITIDAGAQATYTITVTNNGPGDATGVTLTDTVPSDVAAPGWAVGGANAGACSPNPVAGGAVLTCNFGTVPNGQSRTITLTATTTTANCPVINNSAHVAASNEAAAQQGNNSAGPVPINVNCPETACPDAFVGFDNVTLGAAATFAVLELEVNTFSMSGPKTLVDGDVGIGPLATGQFNAGTVTGDIIVDPTGKISKLNVLLGGVVVTQALGQAVIDATNLSAAAAALTPTQTFSADVTTSLTFSNGGLNVINFEKDLRLSGKTLTFSGGANDVFVLNIFGQFKFDGNSKVVLQGVPPGHVLFNVIGPGDAVKISGGLAGQGPPKTQLIGTVLAVERRINVTGSMVTGQLISGEDIHIDSGTRVICPVP